MKTTKLKVLSLMASLMPIAASAATYVEILDAGQTVGTAQAVPGGIDTITGSVGFGNADLFSFNWSGGAFYVNSIGSTFDSQLFLFNAFGVGIQGNDDGILFRGPAYLQLPTLAAGSYLIGVSGYDYDPYSSSGLIFNTTPYEGLYGPNNLAPLSRWGLGGTSQGDSGTYSINFRQVTPDGNPVGPGGSTGSRVPDGGATIALLGVALSALGVARRKTK